ncbi:MAG TPA: protein phosphatase 2C domain-containing protein, partial [Pedobacter sp.]|uniref:PP2C family protein-serine/threonine phosphatase n=1 Tax=Pedobacter sp. TaxID=1411316 RepID=UPI002CA8FFF1
MEKFGYTNAGPRKTNEDYLGYEIFGETGFFCIADGVGGNNCGEYASKFCVEKFIKKIKEQQHEALNLKLMMQKVNSELIAEASLKPDCKNMATTFIGVLFDKKLANIVHTGDSRLYVLRKNGLKQLTEDHTEAKRLVKEGLLTFEASLTYPRKHILDSALGMEGDILVTHIQFEYEKMDRFLLATDGCYDVFTKKEIRDISITNNVFENFCNSLQERLE